MAKGFLTTLDNAFEESALVDIIPFGKSEPARKKSAAKKRRSGSKRKSFLEALDTALGTSSSAPKPTPRPATKGKRKSFLATLEHSFDDPSLDELIPVQSRNTSGKKKDARKPQSRLSTSLDSKLMTDVRKYADKKDIRIKEVVEEALRAYLKKGE